MAAWYGDSISEVDNWICHHYRRMPSKLHTMAGLYTLVISMIIFSIMIGIISWSNSSLMLSLIEIPLMVLHAMVYFVHIEPALDKLSLLKSAIKENRVIQLSSKYNSPMTSPYNPQLKSIIEKSKETSYPSSLLFNYEREVAYLIFRNPIDCMKVKLSIT